MMGVVQAVVTVVLVGLWCGVRGTPLQTPGASCSLVCGQNAVCEVVNREPTCVCRLGFSGHKPEEWGCSAQVNNCSKTSSSSLKKFYVNERRVKWRQAEAECSSRNMSLATINTPEEQTEVFRIVRYNRHIGSTAFWTAGKVRTGENEMENNVLQPAWVTTGQAFCFTNWKVEEPLVYGQHRCVAVAPDGGWWIPSCERKEPVLCEYHVEESPSCSPVCGQNAFCEAMDRGPTCVCLPGFSGNKPQEWGCSAQLNNCRKTSSSSTKRFYVTRKRIEWRQAEAKCRSRNMSLATINSPEEQAEVFSIIWDIGSTAFWTAGKVTTGENEMENNVLQPAWVTTGQAFCFTNWKEEEPEVYGEHRCVAVGDDGGWWVASCGRKEPVLCEYHVGNNMNNNNNEIVNN